MRITFVSLYYPADPPAAGDFLRRFALYRQLPQQLARRGHDVDFVQLYACDETLTQGGVRYRFIAADFRSRLFGLAVGTLTRRPQVLFELAHRLLRALGTSDILHVHGTQLHLNLALLRRKLPDPALVLHYHGGFPPRQRLMRILQRRNFSAADALLFTASDQAEAFLQAGILRDRQKVHELVETSSEFRPRSNGRLLSGRPVFISTCRLHPIKDPWTTLKGFERVLETYPGAELHHFYRSAELLPELRSYVAARPHLRSSVHFRGERPYNEMEAVYSDADILLQSSSREFSGCSVLDAMACGVVPVVSDIPSFRKITGDGRAGRLFEIGNAGALAGAVSAITDLDKAGSEVRSYFERELSFEAMAARAETIYERILSRRYA